MAALYSKHRFLLLPQPFTEVRSSQTNLVTWQYKVLCTALNVNGKFVRPVHPLARLTVRAELELKRQPIRKNVEGVSKICRSKDF